MGDSVNSANSLNLINHWNMNWNQCKDSVSYTPVAGSNPFTVMTNIFVAEFSEKFTKNTNDSLLLDIYI